MRVVGVMNLVMALVWVPLAVLEPYEVGGTGGFFRIFNAVVFSVATVGWAVEEAVRYRGRGGRDRRRSPLVEEPAT